MAFALDFVYKESSTTYFHRRLVYPILAFTTIITDAKTALLQYYFGK